MLKDLRKKTCEWVRSFPPIRAYLAFNVEERRLVARKFFILWFFSALPLLFATVLPVVTGTKSLFGDISGHLKNLNAEFSETSVLIYSVSYLVPFVYAGIELSRRRDKYADVDQVAPNWLTFPDGYLPMVVLSVVIFSFTVFGYKRVASEGTQSGIVGLCVKWCVYFYAAWCWFLTLLLENATSPPDGDGFRENSKRNEVSAVNLFDKLLEEEGGK